MIRRLGLCVLLAACSGAPAVPPAPEVRSVILYRDVVNILMGDGALCVLDRPGRATAWSGVTSGCPYALAVSVTALPKGPREVLSPGSGVVIVEGQGWGSAPDPGLF